MTKRKIRLPAVGASSLLVIFAVLCLTVFALLSLSTAQAGRRLSDASADAVQAYYQADYQAEEILALLRAGEMPAGVTEADGVYSFSCPVSDRQELQVEVRLDGAHYQVLSWQNVSVAEWQPDNFLEIWDGES